MATTGSRPRSMTAFGALAFGALAYAVFFGVLLYFISFLADVVVPRTVDRGGPEAAWGTALAVNTLLFLVFVVPHSVMARRAVKATMARVVPPHLQRSVYVLVAAASLALLFWQWRPLPDVVWEVQGVGAAVLWGTYVLGWVVVVLSTFLTNHFDLFGLRQVYLHARGRAYEPIGFRTWLLYRVVRHPMMLGFLLVFWGAPRMTVGHALFALLFSGYILLGVRLEERDLTASLPDYEEYARRVPRLLPSVRSVRPDREQGERGRRPTSPTAS